MLIAIISDIHGNLPALEKALRIISKKKVDHYIFLGDVVGYGPWSNECVQLIENIKNSTKILGNHEENFLKKKCTSKNILVRKFFIHSFKGFNKFNEISKYKKNHKVDNIFFSHTINNKYLFNDSKINLKKNTVVGHSHVQFKVKKNGFWLINPGSLGQNRKNIRKSEFGYLNTKSFKVEFMSYEHNINALIKRISLKKYPEECINYYSSRKLTSK